MPAPAPGAATATASPALPCLCTTVYLLCPKHLYTYSTISAEVEGVSTRWKASLVNWTHDEEASPRDTSSLLGAWADGGAEAPTAASKDMALSSLSDLAGLTLCCCAMHCFVRFCQHTFSPICNLC